MYQTYGDLCRGLLIRLGEEKNVEGDSIIITGTVKSYLKAIPGLLREGLAILATAGKYVVRVLELEGQKGPGDDIVRYDLKLLAPDFYSLDGGGVYNAQRGGGRAADYSVEGGHVLCAPPRGQRWRIYYSAYPTIIPSDIRQEEPLNLDPEVYAILPLYIEGRLRLMSDEDYAFALLTEFEQRRAELMARTMTKASAGVVRISSEERGAEGFLW